MSTIRNETLQFLHRFRWRRRALLILRAVCVFAAIALLVLIGLALVDSRWLIPDAVRWAVSCGGYVFAALAAWLTSLRFLFGLRGQRELAQVIENTEPSLQEELLSAVELSDPTGEQAARYDSEGFRARVQQDVAEHVRRLDIGQLLPFKRVAGAVTAAIVGAVLLVGLLLVPGLHFGSFFQRAALPLLNFARPSEIGIHVIEPAPADRSVPEFDSVRLLVETDGPPVDIVMLEYVDAEKGRTKMEMRRERNGRFSADVPVEQANVKYRMRAKNSITRYFEFTPRERPRVKHFVKTYEYPAYSQLPPKVVEENIGDVSALEDTFVDLNLTTNYVVSRAELHLESANSEIENQTIPLTVDADGRLHGRLPVTPAFAAYRVHLVDEPDGVTNKFSPLYEIRSVVDQAPLITMSDPTEGRELYADEVLPIAGTATDDIGLARVAYVWQVDGNEWNEVETPIKSNAREQSVTASLHLASIENKNAQLLMVKMIAVDGKGNLSETPPVRFALRERPTDGDPTENLKRKTEERMELARQARDAARQIRQNERKINQARGAMSKKPADRSAQEQLDLIEVADAARRNDEQTEKLREQFKTAIRNASNRSEEEELMAAARVASYVERELLEPLVKQLESAAREETARKGDRDAANRANEAAWEMEKMARALETMAAADKAAEVAVEAERLSERQQRLAKDSREEQKQNRATPEEQQAMQERQDFNELAAEKLRDELAELSDITPTGEKKRAANLARDLKHKAEQAQKRESDQQAQLAREKSEEKAARKSDENFANIAEQTKNDFVHAERQTDEIAQRLAQQAAKERENLIKENLAATSDLEQIKHHAEAVANEREKNERNPLNDQQKEKLAGSERQLQEKLKSAAQQLRDNAEMEEQREMPDIRAAADQSLLASAIEAMTPASDDAAAAKSDGEQAEALEENASQARERAERLAKAEKARDSLEADAQARQLAKALAELAADEADASELDALQEQPDAWQAARQRMQQLPKALKEARLEKEAVELANKLKDSDAAKELDAEMRRRHQDQQQDNAEAKDVDQQLAELSEQADQQKDVAAEKADAAREALASLAPTIPERSKDLAKQLADQAHENAEAAQQAKSDQATPEKNAVAASEAADENASTREQLEELLDDLRRDANTRDLSNANEREQARDADDALAQMKNDSAADDAQDALENAAEASDKSKQSSGMAEASKQQKQLSEKLAQLADQLTNPDKGREELRAEEAETESGEQIAQDFDRAEKLAEMLDQADADTDAAIAALEEELKNNPAMQIALEEIASKAATEAAKSIQKAAEAESKLAEKTGEQSKAAKEPSKGENAQSAKQQSGINKEIGQAAEDLARSSRHQERLENAEQAESASKLSEAAQRAAEGELAEAKQSLADQSPIADSAEEVGEAKSELEQLAQSAESMAAQAAQAAEAETADANQQAASDPSSPSEPSDASPSQQSPSRPGRSAEQNASQPSPAELQQSSELADALDQLDRAMANANSQPSPQSPTAQQKAASSLSQAMQSQSQSMADTRAPKSQSPTPPGQPSPSQQAQNPSQPSSENASPGQPSKTDSSAAPKDGSIANATEYQELGAYEVTEAELRDWGKLPPQVAKQILESRRDGVSPEYRAAIESYYKALGERARSNR